MAGIAVKVTWVSNQSLMGGCRSGNSETMDGLCGGALERYPGPIPLEMLLSGLIGNRGADVIYVLNRMRQSVIDRQMKITAEWAEVDPRIFSRILAIYTVAGQALSETLVPEAVRFSREKYCSALTMLSKTVKTSREVPELEKAQ